MPLRFSALFALGVGVAAVLVAPQKASAQASGTWTNPSPVTPNDLWSTTTNWAGGIVADGANNTADFSTLDIADQFGVTGFGAVRVTLDTSRTIGHLKFGDTGLATGGAWDVTDPTLANILTLADATKPTITADALTPFDPGGVPPTVDDSRISARIAGVNGFNKLGNGILSVTGTYDAATAANNLTGVVNVNAGTLRILAGATFDTETAITPDVTSFTVASGANLSPAAGAQNISMASGSAITDASANVSYITAAGTTTITTTGGGIGFAGTAAANAASGIAITGAGTATVNWNLTGTASLAGISGTGGTAIVNIGGAGLVRIDRNWAQAGALASVTFNGTRTDTLQSTIELRNNGGAVTGFQNEAVILNNVIVQNNQNTGGNDNTFGSLSGDANAVIQGGVNGAGSSQYFIGGLNTDTTFAGTFRPNTAGDRSLTLVKQGTGTLTLSGTINNVPSINQGTIERRGGVFRVMAGTLKLTNTARMPAGVVDATFGNLLYTVDVRAGATLDVSGTSTPYQSSALQQVIGAGTIVGSYDHNAGTIAPGNTSVMVGARTTANLTPVAGTLAFTGNFTLSGGAYTYDMSTNPAAGNDLITVSGVTTLTSGVITPNYISAGLAPAAGSVYTLLTSGSFAGSAAGLSVNFPGRQADPSPFVDGNALKVTVPTSVVGNLVWRGDDVTNPTLWNVQTTPNFFNTGTAAADVFFNGDSVTFDDTATGSTDVSLPANVAPTSVNFSNATKVYTLGGTALITGSAALTKTGAGLVTITTANTYTGGTTISGGGVLSREATGGLGNGTITLSSGELQTRGWTNPAPIVVSPATTNKITLLGGGTTGVPDAATTVAVNQDGALTGSGTLIFQNDTTNVGAFVAQAVDLRGNNSGFTGTIKFLGTSRTAPRFTTINSAGTNVAYDLGNGDLAGVPGNGTSLSQIVQSATQTLAAETIAYRLGSITGGVNSRLDGYGSSGGVAPVRWEIGGLNTSTTFDGIITDGNMTNVATIPERAANITHILKEGTGTLTLTGLNTYTGKTTAALGTLEFTQPTLADTSEVRISSAGILKLSFAGQQDIINDLIIGGVPQAAGLWGRVGSIAALGATFESPRITGDGLLSVTTLGPTPLAGDFDNNKIVAAADLAFWRRSYGAGAGGDADFDGDTDGNDFAIWQRNLGMTIPTVAASGAVPEPAAWVLAAIVLPVVASGARRRRAA